MERARNQAKRGKSEQRGKGDSRAHTHLIPAGRQGVEAEGHGGGQGAAQGRRALGGRFRHRLVLGAAAREAEAERGDQVGHRGLAVGAGNGGEGQHGRQGRHVPRARSEEGHGLRKEQQRQHEANEKNRRSVLSNTRAHEAKGGRQGRRGRQRSAMRHTIRNNYLLFPPTAAEQWAYP